MSLLIDKATAGGLIGFMNVKKANVAKVKTALLTPENGLRQVMHFENLDLLAQPRAILELEVNTQLEGDFVRVFDSRR